MKCRKCKIELNIKNLSCSKNLCIDCYNEYYQKYRKNNREKINKYSNEWNKTHRWLNGGVDNFLLGENIKYKIISRNGRLYII